MSLSRTQISLSEDDRAVLEARRRQTGQSMSALIREAIHATYGRAHTTDSVRAALEATFGVVSTHSSGAELVDSIRSGRRMAELS